MNTHTENLGARRLHAILEKVLADLSFEAPERTGSQMLIDRNYVRSRL